MNRLSYSPLSLAVTLCLVAGGTASAATFQVTNGNDSGPGSLREAITLAEANAEADDINLPTVTVTLASQLPDITTDVTIIGQGWADSVIDGGNSPGGSDGVKAFFVAASGNLVLDGVNVTNCYHLGGAGVTSLGQLTVIDSRFSDNRVFAYGGALSISDGDTALVDSTFIRNEANGGGAVILSSTATFDADGCTFTSNSALGGTHFGWGGALALLSGQTTITNSTISGNFATQLGGGVYVDFNATVDLVATTLFSNGAAASRVGVHVEGASPVVTLSHTLVGDGCGFGGGGAITSAGYNLENGNTCGLVPGLGDLVNTDPLLGPLQANGGPTDTHAMPLTSPAVDGGDTSCGTAIDQRGSPRPVDGDLDQTAECDIGAVELQIIFWDGFESGDWSAWSFATQ